eukprot:scaffold39358_cov23-Tisochrysis_lutea.AAC.1
MGRAYHSVCPVLSAARHAGEVDHLQACWSHQPITDIRGAARAPTRTGIHSHRHLPASPCISLHRFVPAHPPVQAPVYTEHHHQVSTYLHRHHGTPKSTATQPQDCRTQGALGQDVTTFRMQNQAHTKTTSSAPGVAAPVEVPSFACIQNPPTQEK